MLSITKGHTWPTTVIAQSPACKRSAERLPPANWFSSTPVTGDDLVATVPYLNRANGKPPNTVNLFAGYVALDPGKTVRAVRLPKTGPYAMHAFDMAIG